MVKRNAYNIKMDLRDRMRWYRLNLSGSGYGPVEGSCENGSIECWEVLE
jgi:hypothetical protein